MAFEKYDFTPLTQAIHQALIENVSPLLTTIIEWTIIGVLYLCLLRFSDCSWFMPNAKFVQHFNND